MSKALFGRLDELGYREGRNLHVERRFAEGRFERLPALAAELVALRPDIVYTSATQATLAAAKATNTIPIVFTGVVDPVGMGIVKSLGRPGGNVTGVTTSAGGLMGKRLQLLKEVYPSAARVAVLHNPLNAAELPALAALREAGTALALTVRVIEVKLAEDLDLAFKNLRAERPDLVLVIESPFSFTHRARIVELANAQRLATMYGLGDFVEAGGLMSYSTNRAEHNRAAATFIDKILKGAKPADLPVEQPTRFELVLNQKTAKASGVKFPAAILLRADRIIE